MKIVSNLILGAFLCLNLVSCSTSIDFHVPLNRFETPESSGKQWSGDVGFFSTSSHKITVISADDCSLSIFCPSNINDDEQIDRRHFLLGGTGHLGFLDNLDILISNPTDAPLMVGLKYQILGVGRETRSPGHKMSISAAYGRMSESDSNENIQYSNNSGSIKDYTGEETVSTYDFSLIYGYRLGKNALTYLTLFRTEHKAYGTLTPKDGPDVISVSGKGDSTGALLGAELGGEYVSVIVEGGIADTRFKKANKSNGIGGVAVKFHW